MLTLTVLNRLQSRHDRCRSGQEETQFGPRSETLSGTGGQQQWMILICNRTFGGRWNLFSQKGVCCAWRSRVIISSVARLAVVEELHETNARISRTKALSRSYVWCSGLDGEVEQKLKECISWQDQKPPPGAPLHPWKWSERPWQGSTGFCWAISEYVFATH